MVGRALGRLQSGRSCGSIPGAVSIPIPVLRDLIKLPFKRLDLRVARVTMYDSGLVTSPLED